MQLVFMVSAVALFVPVLYHRTRNEETDSLNKDAPGVVGDVSIATQSWKGFLAGLLCTAEPLYSLIFDPNLLAACRHHFRRHHPAAGILLV